MTDTHETRCVIATILCKRPIYSFSTWYRPPTVLEGCRVSWLLAVAGWTSCLIASYSSNKNTVLRRMALFKMIKMQMVVEYLRCRRTQTAEIKYGRKKTNLCCILSFGWIPGVWILWCKLTPRMKMEQSVPKRRHIKFRNRGMIWRKEYKIMFLQREVARRSHILCPLSARPKTLLPYSRTLGCSRIWVP